MQAIHSRFSPINISLFDLYKLAKALAFHTRNIHRIAPLNPGRVLA